MRSIKQNIWGNWNGYEGNRKVAEFGTDEHEAERWAGTRTDFPADLDRDDLIDDGRCDGYGESYAERNA